MKKDYVPERQNDVVTWMRRFAQLLPTHGTSLGLSPEQVSDMTGQIDAFGTLAQQALRAKAEARSKVSAMQQAEVETVRAMRRLVRQMKASPGYSATIGRELGIVGPEDSTDTDTPVLRVRMLGGSVLITYRKGRFDGVYIYASRGADEAFELLTTDTRSPYLDKRPNAVLGQPEERRYYAYFMMADTRVGKQSAIVSVLV